MGNVPQETTAAQVTKLPTRPYWVPSAECRSCAGVRQVRTCIRCGEAYCAYHRGEHERECWYPERSGNPNLELLEAAAAALGCLRGARAADAQAILAEAVEKAARAAEDWAHPGER